MPALIQHGFLICRCCALGLKEQIMGTPLLGGDGKLTATSLPSYVKFCDDDDSARQRACKYKLC